MAFRYKNGLNHTPDWYENRATQEPRGGVLVGALKRDLATLGYDYDPKLEFTENVGIYKEAFEAAMKGEIIDGKRFDQTANLCYVVMEHETLEGSKPTDQFKGEPFDTISELMLEHGINADTMRHFLKWRSRQRAVQQREKAIEAEKKASYRKSKELLTRLRQKKPITPKPAKPPEFFGYEGDDKLPAVAPEPPESQ